MQTLSPKQLTNFLIMAIKAKEPVLISGSPGVGKSDIVAQATEQCKANLIISHPVVCDPTDAKGLPWPDKEGQSARFLPYGDLESALKAKTRTVWFLDDLGQAMPSVQASFMQLILSKRIGDHILPDTISFIAATNRRGDKASVQGILEPVKSRFATIIELATNLDSWMDWALTHDINPEIVAFLRLRPDLLHDFKPTQDMTNSPCPRTWASLSRLLTLNMPRECESAIYSGAIGEGAATEFIMFERIYRNIPDPDLIIKNPDKAPIPKQPSELYAVCAALAYRTSDKNVSSILKYSNRLSKNDLAEFGVLLIKDAYKRCPAIGETKEFISLINDSEIGKLIVGD